MIVSDSKVIGKPTSGPWTIREVRHSNVPGKRAFAIDFNEDQEQVVDWVYEEADAHLISAAPELLEALEWAMKAGRLDYQGRSSVNAAYCDKVDMARAAIAKAKGLAQ